MPLASTTRPSCSSHSFSKTQGGASSWGAGPSNRNEGGTPADAQVGKHSVIQSPQNHPYIFMHPCLQRSREAEACSCERRGHPDGGGATLTGAGPPLRGGGHPDRGGFHPDRSPVCHIGVKLDELKLILNFKCLWICQESFCLLPFNITAELINQLLK